MRTASCIVADEAASRRRVKIAAIKFLVTGAAGFIGSHLSLRLLARGDQVTGIDNLNDYYDVTLKEARLARLQAHSGFSFRRHDIADREGMAEIFAGERFDCVVNLAAQAGVRYSLVNPHAYVDANVTGFLNILEGVRHHGGHLVFASSSSVECVRIRGHDRPPASGGHLSRVLPPLELAGTRFPSLECRLMRLQNISMYSDFACFPSSSVARRLRGTGVAIVVVFAQ